jgi:hypothetical protein
VAIVSIFRVYVSLSQGKKKKKKLQGYRDFLGSFWRDKQGIFYSILFYSRFYIYSYILLWYKFDFDPTTIQFISIFSI